jgi:hypothetical protein
MVREFSQTVRSSMVGAMACASLCAMACVAVVDESGPQVDTDVNVVSAALSVTSLYSVSTGQNPVPMTRVDLSVCFLMGIFGSLDNANGLSVVQIRAPLGSTTNWSLETNPGGDRRAWARCLYGVSPSERTGPHTWSQGAAALDIGSSSDRICLLTGVQGKFNGNGEQARTRISGGRWILDGTSGTRENYMITAQAYCVLGVSSTERSGEYSLTSNVNGMNALQTQFVVEEFTPSFSDFCALTRVQGKFNSGTAVVLSDALFVAEYGNGPAKPWELRARGDSSTVQGGARCIHWNAF